MLEERTIFIYFLRRKGLKLTRQREEILQAFLKIEEHPSTDDLYKVIQRKNPNIGHATVFRTLKLLENTDLAPFVPVFSVKFSGPADTEIQTTPCYYVYTRRVRDGRG